jgi:hypothetical protein
MIDGDESESEGDLVKHQARMGLSFFSDVRFRHEVKKEGATRPLLPPIIRRRRIN